MAPFFKNQERGACVHTYMHISLFLQKKKDTMETKVFFREEIKSFGYIFYIILSSE